MSSTPIWSDHSDWPSAIGNFILYYGILDYLVFVFLKDHLSEKDFGSVEELHFHDRVQKVAQLVKEGYPAEQQITVARLVERLNPVRDLRNHIAHGHLYLRFDAETKKPIVSLLRAKDLDAGALPGTKHLEFEELLGASATLKDLIEELERMCGFKVWVPPQLKRIQI